MVIMENILIRPKTFPITNQPHAKCVSITVETEPNISLSSFTSNSKSAPKSRRLNCIHKFCLNVLQPFKRDRSPATLYDCVRPILILGRILLVLPFSVSKSVVGDVDLNRDFHFSHSPKPSTHPKFTMKSSKKSNIRSILIKICITVHLTMVTIQEKDRLRKVEIMSWLWKLTLLLFCAYVLTILWTLQFQRNKWITIFDKSVEIHEAFKKLGLSLNVDFLPQVFCFLSIFHFILGLPHILYARALDRKILDFTNLVAETGTATTEWKNLSNLGLQLIWLVIQIVLNFIGWTAFHFSDILRIALAIYFWILFSRLNKGIEELCFDSTRLHEVMSLHLKISNLLGLINSIISPLTFMGCIFFVFYACFYVNFVLWGLASRVRQILFAHFLLKNIVIFIVSADVSAKAHGVSEWLEWISTSEETIPLQPEKFNKLIIFTSQVYHRDAIGFRGFHFFTISTSFFGAIVSLIATYTVVITQIADVSQTGGLQTRCNATG